MSQATLGARVVDVFFIVAWLFPLLFIGGYYFRVVRMRLREIERTFFGGALAPEHFSDLKRHPGARYLPSGLREATGPALRLAVREEFDRYQAPRRYFVPLLMLAVTSACGLWLCREWVHQRWFVLATAAPARFPDTIRESVIMSLAGAYAWGIYEVIERGRDRTLTPSEIKEVCFRWLVAVPVGHAFSLIAIDGAEPFFAFAASAFPLKDIRRLVRENGLKKLGQSGDASAPMQERLHTTIEGVSDVMASRLEELNTYTVLDMAYANMITLMVKTGVPIRSVIDWIDQALFHVYTVESQRKILREQFGVRCTIDVCEFIDLHVGKRDATFGKLFEAMKMATPDALADFLNRIGDDEQVRCLYNLWYPDGAPVELGGDPAKLRAA